MASTIQAHLHAPRITADEARGVLAGFGIRLGSDPRNLSMSWRNEIAILETSAGLKVLKRYRPTVSHDAVVYEHSILDQLERVAFPATRLEHTSADDTVVELDGRLHALFQFEPGRNFASTYLSNNQRGRLAHAGGATLAGFHRALSGFTPSGAHHLGLAGSNGHDSMGLDGYLDLLDVLASSPLEAANAGAAETQTWLIARAGQIRELLSRDGPVVEAAPLPTTLIHGDYGTHNLLFRADGTAVVHDLELSRVDWRLLDLVIAFVRIGRVRHQVFLDAYRAHGELEDAELEVLPALWRYQLVTGVIRSWDGYGRLGGLQRLATAKARLERVERDPGPAVGSGDASSQRLVR